MPSKKLAPLLSLNAGYVDTAGFLALHGLFTAHVTGNFVTIGAALAFGSSGVIAKLLALPVFCLTIFVVRLISMTLFSKSETSLHTLLWLKLILLIAAGAEALTLGPFATSDTLPAIITGMTFVVAMAIQNAVQRMHLTKSPPTTLMTGSTTQIMIDLADRLRLKGTRPDDEMMSRMMGMLANVGGFAIGCAMAALLYTKTGMSCFIVPPLAAALALVLRKDA
ncbi:DUF1275 domain-containing protein [Allorhizobium sp. BGMRC 0089]|uniref:YoaK family protein n=1 Tax=Allorhizobium sonneratiae TaxID=2934936 RepID=UPI0020346EE7|nr:YoaK family protein [Allorhizobium sonneratiae]MCM2294626.1 DUF1275 domain-containing protein [Allorhizobium sonneratiae]